MREQYPLDYRFGPKGQDNQAESPLPRFPTVSLPGTPEKIAIMQMRLLDKTNLFHPDDGKW